MPIEEKKNIFRQKFLQFFDSSIRNFADEKTRW